MVKGDKREKKEIAPASRDYTIHLHKLLHGVQFKKRAVRAAREIKRFAQKEMFTKVFVNENNMEGCET